MDAPPAEMFAHVAAWLVVNTETAMIADLRHTT